MDLATTKQRILDRCHADLGGQWDITVRKVDLPAFTDLEPQLTAVLAQMQAKWRYVLALEGTDTDGVVRAFLFFVRPVPPPPGPGPGAVV